MTTTKYKTSGKPTLEQRVGPQTHIVKLGRPLIVDPHMGFIGSITEHKGKVITPEQHAAGRMGTVSLKRQFVAAQELLEKNMLGEDEGPYQDRHGSVMAFKENVEELMGNPPANEKLMRLLEVLVNVLKPVDLPGEEEIEAHFQRKFHDMTYGFMFKRGVTVNKDGPLVAGDILTQKERVMEHEELGRNLVAIDNPLHLVMLAVSVLRMAGCPAYAAMARKKIPNAPMGIPGKVPLVAVLNADLSLDMDPADPLAAVTSLSQDLPVMESIELLTDRAVMSMLHAQGALNRIIRTLDKMEEKAALRTTSEEEGMAPGTLTFVEPPVSLLDIAQAYRRIMGVIYDGEFIEAATMAGSDLWNAYALWPDPEEVKGKDLGYMHVKAPMILIAGNEQAPGLIRAFVQSSMGLAKECLKRLPSQFGLRPENSREWIGAFNVGERLMNATREEFSRRRDEAVKAIEGEAEKAR
ncbi:MAG: hypothetical protein ABII71_01275 [Candidatus Micrarchaeota archaeon]